VYSPERADRGTRLSLLALPPPEKKKILPPPEKKKIPKKTKDITLGLKTKDIRFMGWVRLHCWLCRQIQKQEKKRLGVGFFG
jgi:hypothetical protein